MVLSDVQRQRSIASRAFYSDKLGFTVIAESSGSPDDPAVRTDPDRIYGGVVFEGPGIHLGLRPVADPDDRFVSERVGLDHLSFTVASHGALVEAAAALEERGVPHGEVTDLPDWGLTILSFSDPDGVHLELSAALERSPSTPA